MASRNNKESNVAVADPSAAPAQSTRVNFKGIGNSRPPEGKFPATFTGGKWATPKAGGDPFLRAEYTIKEGTPDPVRPDIDLGGRKAFTNYRILSEDNGERWGAVFFRQDMTTLGEDPDVFDSEIEDPETGDMVCEKTPEEIMADVYGADCIVEIIHQSDSDRFYNLKVHAADSI